MAGEPDRATRRPLRSGLLFSGCLDTSARSGSAPPQRRASPGIRLRIGAARHRPDQGTAAIADEAAGARNRAESDRAAGTQAAGGRASRPSAADAGIGQTEVGAGYAASENGTPRPRHDEANR